MPEPQYPELDNYPDEAGQIGDFSVLVRGYAHGVMIAQDGEDLFSLVIHLALGPSPSDGMITARISPEAARSIAAELVHLAEYAELGVEARPYE